MSNPNKFPLSQPVTVDGVTYTDLTWRSPKGRDLRKMLSSNDIGQAQHHLLIDLCEVSGEVLDEIPAADYAALSERIAPLLGSPTSKKT